MRNPRKSDKENVTVNLDRQTLRKVKVLAAMRATSISGFIAHQIETRIGEEEAYQRARRQAIPLLNQGFQLGGVISVTRDELHER